MCKSKFEFPSPLSENKSSIVEPEMKILIPLLDLHRDHKYYENPEKFDYGRFLGDQIRMNSEHFFPFGIGPMICITNIYSLLEMKITLFILLARCNL